MLRRRFLSPSGLVRDPRGSCGQREGGWFLRCSRSTAVRVAPQGSSPGGQSSKDYRENNNQPSRTPDDHDFRSLILMVSALERLGTKGFHSTEQKALLRDRRLPRPCPRAAPQGPLLRRASAPTHPHAHAHASRAENEPGPHYSHLQTKVVLPGKEVAPGPLRRPLRLRQQGLALPLLVPTGKGPHTASLRKCRPPLTTFKSVHFNENYKIRIFGSQVSPRSLPSCHN